MRRAARGGSVLGRGFKQALSFTSLRLGLLGFLLAGSVVSLAMFARAHIAGVSLAARELTLHFALSVTGLGLLYLLPEELLFRGYLLRWGRRRMGTTLGVLASAFLFGCYHTVGSQFWVAGLLFQFAVPAAMGLVLASAAIVSRGIALPAGLHLGGNIAQVSFVPASTLDRAASVRPDLADPYTRLFAPDLAVQLPILVAIAICGIAVATLAATRRAA